MQESFLFEDFKPAQRPDFFMLQIEYDTFMNPEIEPTGEEERPEDFVAPITNGGEPLEPATGGDPAAPNDPQPEAITTPETLVTELVETPEMHQIRLEAVNARGNQQMMNPAVFEQTYLEPYLALGRQQIEGIEAPEDKQIAELRLEVMATFFFGDVGLYDNAEARQTRIAKTFRANNRDDLAEAFWTIVDDFNANEASWVRPKPSEPGTGEQRTFNLTFTDLYNTFRYYIGSEERITSVADLDAFLASAEAQLGAIDPTDIVGCALYSIDVSVRVAGMKTAIGDRQGAMSDLASAAMYARGIGRADIAGLITEIIPALRIVDGTINFDNELKYQSQDLNRNSNN